jgi:hypothetical protein
MIAVELIADCSRPIADPNALQSHSQIGNHHSLARMDSNHDKQNQNLLCYRYTTGQRLRLNRTGEWEKGKVGERTENKLINGLSPSAWCRASRLPIRPSAKPLDDAHPRDGMNPRYPRADAGLVKPTPGVPVRRGAGHLWRGILGSLPLKGEMDCSRRNDGRSDDT